MAWYNASWTYRVQVTIDHTQVNTDLTDFPVYVDLSDLPAGFFTNVDTAGDDIRVTRADGTTECAFEIVSITVGSSIGELHFKANSISSTSDTSFYIYYGNAGASAYGVADTYGRNAVWSDYRHVYHGDNTTDSTGNSATLTLTGTASVGNTGKVGTCFDSDVAGGYSATFSAEVSSGVDTIVMQTWFYLDSDTNPGTDWEQSIMGWKKISPFDAFEISIGDGGSGEDKIHSHTYGGNTQSASDSQGSTLSLSTWYLLHGVFDQTGNTLKLYINGILDVNATSYTDNSGGFDILLIGLYETSSSEGMDGKNDEVRYSIGDMSSDWITAEYTNQNTPNTFYTVGSQETDTVDTFVPKTIMY